MNKLKMQSPDLTQRNIDAIAELFPTVVTEALDADGNPVRAVDFDALRQELSDHVVEGPQERYQLDWPGKRAAAFAANAPIAKTLRPVREESVNFDTTKNLFIEGDNLDALKLLQESYLGKVKLIYIDPPYNTGNDFLYEDDFAESIADHLQRSGQVTPAGERLVANAESSGRFHSDWLSMLYPRLKLARNLLTNDGVLAVSIDDNEMPRLLQMGTELFGRNGLLNVVAVKSSESSGVKMSHAHRRLPKMKEYVAIFARDRAMVSMSPIRVRKDAGAVQDLDSYLKYYSKIIVNREDPVDRWSIRPVGEAMIDAGLDPNDADAMREFKIQNASRMVYRTNNAALATMRFDVEAAEVVSATGMRYVWWEGKQMLFLADYLAETLGDLWIDLSTINLNKETLGVEGFGQGQKPLALIDRLLALFTSDTRDAIVMDFFVGSGTTAHAVLAQNAKDGGSRRFIVVQWPEALNPKDPGHARAISTCTQLDVPLNIAELCKERIRRAASESLTKGAGFRVVKVDTTNRADVLQAPQGVSQQTLAGFEDNVKPDRSGEDLLFQVIIDWGLELTLPMVTEQFEHHQVFVVEDGALIACFDANVSLALVREIANRHPLRAVFRDAGFASDAARINAEQIFRELSPETEIKAI